MLKLNNKSGFKVRTTSIGLLLLGFTFFAFASIGGDKSRSKKSSLQAGFTPIRTSTGFNLKDGLNYRGSLILKQEKIANVVSYNSIVTYQKGNATYILPNKYKVSLKPETVTKKSSNLQVLQLNIKLCK